MMAEVSALKKQMGSMGQNSAINSAVTATSSCIVHKHHFSKQTASRD